VLLAEEVSDADYCPVSEMRQLPAAGQQCGGPKDKMPKVPEIIQSSETGRGAKGNKSHKTSKGQYLRGPRR